MSELGWRLGSGWLLSRLDPFFLTARAYLEHNGERMNIRIIKLVLAVSFLVGIGAFALINAQTIRKQAGANIPSVSGGLYQSPYEWKGKFYLAPPDEIFDAYFDSATAHTPLTNPPVMNVANADQYLAQGLPGIDVEVDGKHRFYPVQILNWHDVINDTFAGKKLLVTYSAFSGSAAVYERGDETYSPTEFVYNNNALFSEESGDLWSQALGKKVVANSIEQLANPGLTPVAFNLMTWEAWKLKYPWGDVLTWETGANRDYTRHPLGNGFDDNDSIWFPLNYTQTQLSSKDLLYLIKTDNGPVAFANKWILLEKEQTTSAMIGGVSGSLTATLEKKTGTVLVSFVPEDSTQAKIDSVPFVSGFAYSLLALSPQAVLVKPAAMLESSN